jgi:hypothetical protein
VFNHLAVLDPVKVVKGRRLRIEQPLAHDEDMLSCLPAPVKLRASAARMKTPKALRLSMGRASTGKRGPEHR